MSLKPFNIKVVVGCVDEAQARMFQEKVRKLTSEVDLTGSQFLGFLMFYERNKSVIDLAIKDVSKNGNLAIAKHAFNLSRLK